MLSLDLFSTSLFLVSSFPPPSTFIIQSIFYYHHHHYLEQLCMQVPMGVLFLVGEAVVSGTTICQITTTQPPDRPPPPQCWVRLQYGACRDLLYVCSCGFFFVCVL